MEKRTTVFCAVACVLAVVLFSAVPAADEATPPWKGASVETVLEAARPLVYPRGKRLPLYIWSASNPGHLDAASAEELVRQLDRRGIGLVSHWSPKRRDESLAEALTVARAQQKLGTPVTVNASGCLERFFNGDVATAHVDASGRPFWDESFDSGSRQYHMGCPFALDGRKESIRRQVEDFVHGYKAAGVPLDFVFVDWEVDGPIEFGGAQEASKRCVRCQEHIADIDNFLAFQKAVRDVRGDLQRYALSEPILAAYPHALVGNYAEYPHNGFRYWYDYFESYAQGQPCIDDQGAKYRHWANTFPLTGYTCAMPVAYTWYRTFGWYHFDDPDYHWFYNMLLVDSNAGQNTPPSVPIVSFVHWHTTEPPKSPDPAVKQLSAERYQELLWHMLLRGTDTFFMWCPGRETFEESRLVHEVYAAAQEYDDFLDHGTPVTFDVPPSPGPIVSALRLGNRLLVRRTEFGDHSEAVELVVGGQRVKVEPSPGKCQILTLDSPEPGD